MEFFDSILLGTDAALPAGCERALSFQVSRRTAGKALAR
jgi:hypothetical protein